MLINIGSGDQEFQTNIQTATANSVTRNINFIRSNFKLPKNHNNSFINFRGDNSSNSSISPSERDSVISLKEGRFTI